MTGEAGLCSSVPSLLSVINFGVLLDEALLAAVNGVREERLYGGILVVGCGVIIIGGHVKMFRRCAEGHHGMQRECGEG